RLLMQEPGCGATSPQARVPLACLLADGNRHVHDCAQFAAHGAKNAQPQALPQECRASAFIGGGVAALTKGRNRTVKHQVLFAGLLVACVATPLAAQAQGVPGGVAYGMSEGNRIAGPVGAVVGGAVGGVIGGVQGVFGVGGYPVYSGEPP